MLKRRRLLSTVAILVLLSSVLSCSSTSRKASKRGALLSPSTPASNASGTPTTTLSFLWPVEGKPRLGSFFGWRKKTGRSKGERMHEGIDVGGRMGQKIFASASGRVIDVAYVRGYGRTVIIYHGGGWSTLYAHLSKYRVKKSQDVNAGDVIGLMGKTGRTKAVHLHFEIRKGADPLDPLLFLPSRELERYAPKQFYEGEDEE